MPQLADDCFAFGGPLLPLQEAKRLLAERTHCVAEPEEVPLAAALGRVLAAALIAERAVPPQDNSAVDGYTVFHADLSPDGETRLPVGGRAAAGHPLGRPQRRGEAVRIFTGAPLPEGPETVALQEDCREADGWVAIPPGIQSGANRRRAGEDLAPGQQALPAGRRLRPVDLGLAAGQGRRTLTVARRLRVALFSTGDELAEPGGTLAPGAIFDANRFTLGGLLAAQGASVTDLGILPDRLPTIAAALSEAARNHDLLLTSGGVSEGAEDHVRGAVAAAGALHFWRVAIKPGKPVALGQVGRTAFVGLPGNPVAAAVTFVALVRPLLQRLQGAEPSEPLAFAVVSGFRYRKRTPRQEWLRVSLQPAAGGGWQAVKFPRDGAGILSSLAATQGFAVLPEQTTEVAPGDRLSFIPYSEVLGMKLLYFAWLRSRIGKGGEEVAPPAEVRTVRQLIAWLAGRGPAYAAALADLSRLRVAVNQDYVELDHPVAAGDEVALFPPVTGASLGAMIRVQQEDFELGRELAALTAGNRRIGGLAVFVGLVREMVATADGETPIGAMTLEHYPGMTQKQLAAIEQEALSRWPLEASLIVHRYGRLEPGDNIVLVACASAHREAALEACHFLIDWLKTKAPFWKLEESEGEARWIEARSDDEAATARWQAKR